MSGVRPDPGVANRRVADTPFVIPGEGRAQRAADPEQGDPEQGGAEAQRRRCVIHPGRDSFALTRAALFRVSPGFRRVRPE
jgi:hypothetical protein